MSGSVLKNVDTSLNSLQAQILTLTGLQNGDQANFQIIDANFDAIDISLNSKQDIINSSNKLTHRVKMPVLLVYSSTKRL